MKFYALVSDRMGGRPAHTLELLVSPVLPKAAVGREIHHLVTMHGWLKEMERGYGGLIAWQASGLLKKKCLLLPPSGC